MTNIMALCILITSLFMCNSSKLPVGAKQTGRAVLSLKAASICCSDSETINTADANDG